MGEARAQMFAGGYPARAEQDRERAAGQCADYRAVELSCATPAQSAGRRYLGGVYCYAEAVALRAACVRCIGGDDRGNLPRGVHCYRGGTPRGESDVAQRALGHPVLHRQPRFGQDGDGLGGKALDACGVGIRRQEPLHHRPFGEPEGSRQARSVG